jgi:hypothetical protein
MRTSMAIIEREGERSENHIKKLWLAFQAADVERTQRGLEFGKAMCELRVSHKRVSGETRSTPGFEGVCDRLEIPRATAYRWMERYEVSIGKREPKTDREPDSTADTAAPLVGEVIGRVPQAKPKPPPHGWATLQGETLEQGPAITPTPSPSCPKIGDTPEVQADHVADRIEELITQSLKELFNTDHYEEFRNHLKRRLRRWIEGL